jgi:hypothetical protein
MGVRASQFYVSVVGTENASTTNYVLQVHRIYADVLVKITGSDLNESASDTLNVTDLAHAWLENKSVTDTLNITDNATYFIFNQDQDVADTLNITDTAFGARVMHLGVSQSISFISNGGRALTFNGDSTLTITDAVVEFNYVDDRKPCGNTLNLTQTVLTLSGIYLEQSLGLSQSVTVQAPLKPAIVQWLALSQHTSTPHRAFITDTLGLTHLGRVPLPTQHIVHTLNITDVSPIGRASSVISFTHTATFGFSLTAANTLNITDEMTVQGNFIRTVEHDLGVGHALTWLEDTPCNRKQYIPFQGENTIETDVTPPSSTLQDPQGSVTDRFSLYQPPLGIRTDEVIIRAPELDNRDRNAYTRVNRETRGGELIVYADPIWPKVRTMAVTITGITEVEVDALQTFLQDTVGQLIGITDWEGRLWQGFIVNPNEVATQDGKGRWTVSLEFEGEMLEVQQPGNDDGNGMAMNLSQSVSVVIV